VIRKTSVTNTLNDNGRHSFHLYFSTRSGINQVFHACFFEYLGTWETLYNPNFNPIEFERVKKAAGCFPLQYSASSSIVSSRKLTGRNPSLQEIMADFGFFIQPS